MALRPILRPILAVVAVLLLPALAYPGITDGAEQWSNRSMACATIWMVHAGVDSFGFLRKPEN